MLLTVVGDAWGWAGDKPASLPHTLDVLPTKSEWIKVGVSHQRIGCGKGCPSPSLFEKCTGRRSVGTNSRFLFQFIRDMNDIFHIARQRQVSCGSVSSEQSPEEKMFKLSP